MQKDHLNVKGFFHCKIFEHGKLAREFSGDNLIVDNGKAVLLAGLISGMIPVTRIGFGQGTTPPAASDTIISAPNFFKNINTALRTGPTAVEFDWVLGTSEANGINITEFGLLFADGQMFARKTGITVAKVPSITISGQWTITIL